MPRIGAKQRLVSGGSTAPPRGRTLCLTAGGDRGASGLLAAWLRSRLKQVQPSPYPRGPTLSSGITEGSAALNHATVLVPKNAVKISDEFIAYR